MARVADNTRRLSRSSFRRRASLIVLGVALLGGLAVAGYALALDPDVLSSEQLSHMSHAQLSQERDRTMRLMFIGTLIFAAGPVLVILGAVSFGILNRLRRQSTRSHAAHATPHPTLPLHIPHVSLKVADSPGHAAEPRRASAPDARTSLMRAS